jgi:hypothetical protein
VVTENWGAHLLLEGSSVKRTVSRLSKSTICKGASKHKEMCGLPILVNLQNMPFSSKTFCNGQWSVLAAFVPSVKLARGANGMDLYMRSTGCKREAFGAVYIFSMRAGRLNSENCHVELLHLAQNIKTCI